MYYKFNLKLKIKYQYQTHRILNERTAYSLLSQKLNVTMAIMEKGIENRRIGVNIVTPFECIEIKHYFEQ